MSRPEYSTLLIEGLFGRWTNGTLCNHPYASKTGEQGNSFGQMPF